MSGSQLPPFARAWLLQRRAGADAVADVECAELRDLDVGEALRLADALLEATPLDSISEQRKTSSGLVEQQRLFALARR